MFVIFTYRKKEEKRRIKVKENEDENFQLFM